MVNVYLLHFNEKFKRVQHYMGSAENLAVRLNDHRKGKGAKLLKHVQQAGIDWKLVRVWTSHNRSLEYKLKSGKNHKMLCPICNPKVRGLQTDFVEER